MIPGKPVQEYNFNGTMKVVASSKAIKSTPYGSSETVKTVKTNDEISVIGYVYNEYGNLWYKTASGDYIHSNYLSVIENDSLPPSNYLYAKFKVMCSEKAVKNDPVSSSDTIGTVKKDEVVTVIGYLYNEYDNLWYVLEDGGCVAHHYLELVSSDIRTPSNYLNEELLSKASKSLRYEPYGSSEQVGTIEKNSDVKVIGYLYNRFGNLWYMTEDEEFIFCSYLEQTNKDSKAPSNYEYRKFTANIEKLKKTEPYEVAETARTISKSETITTIGYLTNLYGNKWYITDDECYVYPSSLTCVHQYTSKVTTAATCKATGVKTYTCSACSYSYTEAIAKNASNHTGGTEVKNAKTATCTAEGYTGDTYCKGCGVKTKSGTSIAKTAHNSNTTIPAVAATCSKTGLTEGKKCSACGTITVAQQTVAKTSHTYTSKVTTAATCKSTGVKTYTCSACSNSYTETIAKNASNHAGGTEVKNAKKATCSAEGYTGDTYCKGCGVKTKSGTKIAKTAHTYKSETVIAPTCTSNGLVMFTCSCGDNYSEDIKATGHSYGDDGVCRDCELYNKDYDKNSGSTDSANCSCNCHKTGFMGFIWKIINIFNKLFKNNKTCACGVAHY